MKQFSYRCDRSFSFDPDLFPKESKKKQEETNGQGKEPFVAIALVSGTLSLFYSMNMHREYKLLDKFEEKLPNKHRRGGQSSARFGRLADQSKDRHVGRIAQTLVSSFVTKGGGVSSCVRLVLAGPADIKRRVAEHALTMQYFKDVTILNTDEVHEGSSILALDKVCAANWIQAATIANEDVSIRLVEEYLTDAAKIDRLLFGIEECSGHKDNLELLIATEAAADGLSLETSTRVTLISKEHAFVKRFGSCVGVKWW